MLHLKLEPGDKVFIGEGENAIVVSVERKTSTGVGLGINAPLNLKVNAIFADTSKQFKNRRKGASEHGNADTGKKAADGSSNGNIPSPGAGAA